MSTTPNDPGPYGASGQPGQPSQPEYLGPDSPQASDGGPGAPGGPDGTDGSGRSGKGGRRTALVAGAAVAVVAAVGVGAYGVVQLMAGGESAASALPADSLAYVSLDLDPSASQKVEAYKILRKFPAIKKEIGSQDDLRRTVFEQIQKEGDCKDLDYAKDIEPWIGERVALAAVPDAKKGGVPVFALQVKDETKAKAGFEKLSGCGSGDEGDASGFAFVGDYALLAETQKQADAIAEDAEAGSLADSSDFTETMDKAGDPGIVTMYVSPDAPAAIATAMKADGGDEMFGDSSPFGDIETMYKDFKGAAGVIRFQDGAVEAEFAASGTPSTVGSDQGDAALDTLPASTAAAFSVALRDGWLEEILAQARKSGNDKMFNEFLQEGEQATGLELPEDIETLLGDGFSLSLDESADFKALAESPDPSQLPAGLRIQGNPQDITRIIDKLIAIAGGGAEADFVKVEEGEGQVAIGFNDDYVSSLLEKGDLGSTKAFKDVVPEADKATAALFINFDAGNGLAEELFDLSGSGDAEAKKNVAPLDALGISGWTEGEDEQHGLLRLTTD